MVIVDSSIWIDFLNDRETPGVSCLERLIEDEVDIFTSGIIVQEVLSGIKKKKERDEVGGDFRRLILIMPSLSTHLQAAEIFDACRKRGFTIRSSVDCLIASLAIEHDLSLLQSDRDYHSIAKVFPLKIEKYN